MKTKFDNTEKEALNKTDVMQSVISAKDFRIGNLVYILKKDNTKKIRFWWEKHFIDEHDFPYITDDAYRYIPFFSDFFDKIEKQLIDLNVEYIYSSETNRLFIYFGNFTFQIKHIHQFQNLYFALTEEELTVA
jgi:hypothetical protein